MNSTRLEPQPVWSAPATLRRRSDLVIAPSSRGGVSVWRIKDPVALAYFELTRHEYAILEMLDGQTSLQDICDRFASRFAPLQLKLAQLQAFLAELQGAGLVLNDRPEADVVRYRERERQRRLGALARCLNVLSWRFRGVDPAPLLDWLTPRVGRWINPLGLLMISLPPLAALVLLWLRPAEIRERLPMTHEFLSPAFLGWLWIGVAISKIVHELAHAVTCRLCGGECPQIGVLLLLLAPCLYCDVSDAWLLPGKWARILISAAGIIAEVVIAGGCFLFWWFTVPGILNSLALALAVVCSVNTLLLNGNPLLRYDGYYMLSDLVDEPNLSRKGSEFWTRVAERAVLGIESAGASAGTVRRPVLVAVYGALAAIYRPLVLAAAVWAVCFVLAQQGQRQLGIAAAWMFVIAILGGPAWRAWTALRNPLWRRRIEPWRLGAWLAVLVVLAALAMFLPLPRRVRVEAVVDAPAAPRVYVTVEGRLVDGVEEGTVVQAGELLARLENPALARELEQLLAEQRQLEFRLRELEVTRSENPAAGAQIPAAQESLAAVEARIAERRRDLERLRIVAPCAGTVLPPPSRAEGDAQSDVLPGWSGRPLERVNRGCWLQSGTLVCQVADPGQLEPMLSIGQADADLVRPGQAVRLRFGRRPGEVLSGQV
ncbi:MAG: hypothetical protein EHM42_08605, partial [Planctomycetaceae bacterium]